MSRSNQTELINPAKRFIEFAGGEGGLRYFDKTLGEKGENVAIELPYKFFVLDRVSQVTGGVDIDGGYVGYWSNAVKNLTTQKLIVRSKRGVEVEGFYKDIKGYTGVKFMTGLYVATKNDDGEFQIELLKLKGSSLTAWIEFTKAHRNIYEGAFGITGIAERKKGTNKYYEPVFEHYAKVSEDAENVAQMLDKQLQEYLTAYFAQAGIAEVEQAYSGNGHHEAFYDNEPEMPMGDAYEEPELDSIPF